MFIIDVATHKAVIFNTKISPVRLRCQFRDDNDRPVTTFCSFYESRNINDVKLEWSLLCKHLKPILVFCERPVPTARHATFNRTINVYGHMKPVGLSAIIVRNVFFMGALISWMIALIENWAGKWLRHHHVLRRISGCLPADHNVRSPQRAGCFLHVWMRSSRRRLYAEKPVSSSTQTLPASLLHTSVIPVQY